MNILLLSNSAPNYFHFFNALAQRFAEDGAKVCVAVDSRFSREENQLDRLGFDIHEFSSFFVTHETSHSTLHRYAGFNLNSALLSDFERAEVYGIWGNKVDADYFDRLKSALLCFFEQIFEHYKVETVLYENVSNTFAHFALFVAKTKGATYCGIGGSRLPGRFSITADPLDDSEPQKIFEAITSGEVQIPADVHQWAKEYLASIETVVPDYMKINGLDKIGLLKRYLRKDRITKLKSLLRHAFDSRTDAFQVGNPLRTHLNLFARNVRRRFKVSAVQKLYEVPPQEEKFLLYPMHFHPESSTSILAGTYLDEYEVIRNIAFNLPEGVRLYVKDHISAWGYPTLDFYRRIKRLPNVRLLSPHEQTKQLIKRSMGVITLTSTVGYEALLLNKRVYLLGKVFYEFHAGVTKIERLCELHKTLHDSIANPIFWGDSYNINFVCAYQASTLYGSLNLMLEGRSAKACAENAYPKIRSHLLQRYTQ